MADNRDAEDCTKILKDNEVTTKYAVDGYGCRQLILDRLVPEWVYRMDCLFSDFIQYPVRRRHDSTCNSLLHYILYISAELINRKNSITRGVCSIECTVGIMMMFLLISYHDSIVDVYYTQRYLFLWYTILNLLAQLPKRLLYRNRPWRKKIAIVISK